MHTKKSNSNTNIDIFFRCIWYSCAHHFWCPRRRSRLHAWLGTQLPFLVLWPGFCRCCLQLCIRSSFSGRGPHHSKERDCSGETVSYGAESLKKDYLDINKKIINAHAWHCPHHQSICQPIHLQMTYIFLDNKSYWSHFLKRIFKRCSVAESFAIFENHDYIYYRLLWFAWISVEFCSTFDS